MPAKREYGHGQVIKRGKDSFLVRVPLGKDADGKRKFYSKTVRGTKLDAERHLHEYLRKKSLGLSVQSTRATFRDYMEEWFENVCRQRVRQNTFKHYRYQVERYAYLALGEVRLQAIPTLMLERLTPSSKRPAVKSREK